MRGMGFPEPGVVSFPIGAISPRVLKFLFNAEVSELFYNLWVFNQNLLLI